MGGCGPAGPALVILAAGASRRLGTCKALVDLGGDGRPALVGLIEAARTLGGEPPLVVTGPHHDRIRAALAAWGWIRGEGEGVELEFNPHWRAGRSGSLERARRRRAGRDLLVAPVDCPLVSRQVFETLAAAWHEAEAPALGWLAPRLEPAPGDRSAFGHPVVCGRALAAQLARLPAAEPLRRLRSRARPLWSVAVDDPAILDALDRPADLKKLRAREANRPTDGP